MKYFTIPGTEISVSRLILGCWAFAGGDYWGAQQDKESVKTIHAALDSGVNALDTALAYGNGISEKVVGKAVKGKRDKVIIYDKIPSGKLKYDDVIESAHTILKNLGTDYVDVMQIHWGDKSVPISETLGALKTLLKEGKIRHFGVSNFGPQLLNETLNILPPVSNQLSYSLLSRAVEFEIQEVCVENSIGILAYSPLQQGLLAGKYLSIGDFPKGRMRTRHFSSEHEGVRHGQPGHEGETFRTVNAVHEFCRERNLNMADASLAWLLAQKGMDAVIAGARTVDQIQENINAVDMDLKPRDAEELSRITEPLKNEMGSNADLWSRESRIW